MRLRPGKGFAALQTCSRWSRTPCTQVNLRGPGERAPETSGMCVAGCYRTLGRRLHSDRGGDWTMSRKTIGLVCVVEGRRLDGGRGALRRPPFRCWWCVCLLVCVWCACIHRCSFRLWARRQLEPRGDTAIKTGWTTGRKWDGVLIGSLTKAPDCRPKKKKSRLEGVRSKEVGRTVEKGQRQ